MPSFFQSLAIMFIGLSIDPSPMSAENLTPCALTILNHHIEARSEPDDGVWGPTLEIVIRDSLQPLTRLITVESRPIEACWWADIDLDQRAELIIGLGPDGNQLGGARVFEWDDHTLRAMPLPALPANATGIFRYVVSKDRLWAHPIARGGAVPALPYRLDGGRWLQIGESAAKRFAR